MKQLELDLNLTDQEEAIAQLWIKVKILEEENELLRKELELTKINIGDPYEVCVETDR